MRRGVQGARPGTVRDEATSRLNLWCARTHRLSRSLREPWDALPVESLALMVALIVALAVMGGPLALLLSFLPMRWTRVVAIILGSIAVVDAARMIWLQVSTGATLMGAFGLATGGLALWRCLRRRPAALFAGLPPGTPNPPRTELGDGETVSDDVHQRNTDSDPH